MQSSESKHKRWWVLTTCSISYLISSTKKFVVEENADTDRQFTKMILILVALFSIAILSFLIFFLTKVDADLTLYLYDRYGDPKAILRNKVVWITGASSGLGEHLAHELAGYGCRLILSGRNKERLDAVKAKCIKIGLSDKDVMVLPFNVSDMKDHENCVKKAVEEFTKVDILVNNAGRSQRAMFEEIDISVDKELFDVNVFGTLNLTRKILPHFLQNKKGHVVVTSSCVGKMGAASSASYTGSKHALHGYFETLRTEMCQKNVSVTMLCPGPVFSSFLENAFTGTPGEKFGQKCATTDKRMSTTRCGRLMAVAIAYRLDEAWIAMQPCLTLYYLAQYTPSFFRQVIIGKLYTAERAAKLREGRW